MMRSPLMPFVLALAFTLLTGIAVAMEPYFAGDVAVTRAVQSISPNPAGWAAQVSRLAPAPGKYYVMAIVLTAALFVGGWRGLALVVGFLLLEQYGAESTKAIFKRPRPSPELVSTFGSFSGYTFPSTTITFFSVTFGALGIVAMVRKNAPMRSARDVDLLRHGAAGVPGSRRAWRALAKRRPAHRAHLHGVDLGRRPRRLKKSVTDWLWSTTVYSMALVALAGAIGVIWPLTWLHRKSRRRALIMLVVGLGSAYVITRITPSPSSSAAGHAIDDFAPVFQFREHHDLVIAAPPDRVFAAIKAVSADEIALFKLFTTIRRFGTPGPESILNAPGTQPILDVAVRFGFSAAARIYRLARSSWARSSSAPPGTRSGPATSPAPTTRASRNRGLPRRR